MAATSLVGCGQRITSGQGQRVVIAGAGIIGASIAYHLAKAGASVTVIDKQGPATHATRGSFAWINATWAKQPRQYHSLNQHSVSDWHSLQQALGLPVRWGGSVEWFEDEARQQKLRRQIAEQAEWGERARMLSLAELESFEPEIDFHGAKEAAFSGNDGAIDPVLATHSLLAAAAKLGATIKYPCELIETSHRSDKLFTVNTSMGSIATDKLVLATGAAEQAASHFADIEIPQRSTPGVIAISRPMRRIINRIIIAPGIHMHQRDDGRIVLGEQEGAPKNEAHAQRLAKRPNQFPDPQLATQHAVRMLAVATHFVPAIADTTIEHVYIGWRPLPLDGHPVLGASASRPDVYLALMHSGITLAPVVGQLVAHELTEGSEIERLDEFRPDRDFELVKRY